MGAGPITAPGAMHGSMNQGLSAVRNGVKALQDAISQLPMGSALYHSVLKALTDISKNLEKEGGASADPSGGVQQLLEALRTAKTNPGMAGMMPGGAPAGPSGGPPGAPPPVMPPPPLPPGM